MFSHNIPMSKRIFDIFVSIILILILSPIMGIVAILVRIFHGKPVLFGQNRPGYKQNIFLIYEFRTMTNSCSENGELLSDAKRLTKLGRFLRASSLDELPELFNVLNGEMSLVGPRPLLVQYLERYNAEQARRQDVVPGITGWAQVNGRNALDWDEKFRLDIWYVDHWSFWLDLKILFLTIWKVINREGISQSGQATAKEFMGSEKS
jgi:sugar transferase EpsL